MLLEPGKIGSLTLANRIIGAPHTSNLAGEWGEVSDDLIAYYARRAQGGAGLIYIGGVHAATTIDGFRVVSRQLRIDDACFAGGLYRLTEAVHREGSRIGIQITPGAGAMVGGNLGLKKVMLWRPDLEMAPVSPSAVTIKPLAPPPRTLSISEIKQLVELMAIAAYRAKEAGFDLIEIAAENAYLIGEFLWPDFNQRSDIYGGNQEGRLRFLLEIFTAMREATGNKLPFVVRYNIGQFPFNEASDDGQYVQEAKSIARRLEKAGIDGIHVCVSGRGLGPKETLVPPMHAPEACFAPFAEAIKSVVKIPVILTGRMRDPELADQILREGKADFIGMARPLMSDPDLPKKYAGGRANEVWNCIACSECIRNLRTDLPVRCAINPIAGREREYGNIKVTQNPKKVMVIGAGPAGMEAARLAALRGHRVTLIEKERELGPKLGLISRLPKRKEFRDIVAYYSTAFKQLKNNLEIWLGNELTPALISEMEHEGMLPDAVVITTGGVPLIPETPYRDRKHIYTPIDILSNKAGVGEKVVVIGADVAGCETALLLTSQGKRVTLVEMPESKVGMDIDGKEIEYRIWAVFLSQELSKSGIKIVSAREINAVSDSEITLTDIDGKEIHVEADTIVLSLGSTSKNELARQFVGKIKEIYLIGDAKQPRKIRDAIYEGFTTALKI